MCGMMRWDGQPSNHTSAVKKKGKADDLYRGSMQSKDHRRTALQYPLVYWTLCLLPHYGALAWKPSQGTKLYCLVNRGTLGVVEAQRLSLFGHSARMPDKTDIKKILTASSPWRTGGDHQDTLVLRGRRLSSKAWNPIISPRMKQLA